MMKQYIKRIAIGMTQCLIVLLYLPIIGMMSSCHKSGKTWEIADTSGAKEIVLFCGNPSVGKSSLLNSIVQGPIFESGMSMGEGLTTAQQAHLYEDILYIDTPGLSDVDLKEQAAQEIERALRANNNYKIVFVVTCKAGSVRPDDLATVNAVCDAIRAPFAYGIIFNQVSKGMLAILTKDQGGLAACLSLFHKQPSSYLIIGRDQDMEDAPNVYLPANAEDRQALLDFIAQLKSNSIPAHQEHRIGVMSSCSTSDAKEVVLFCGNPGVGKSSLCNSIFQGSQFLSGASVGRGLTTAKQEYLYEGTLYIDTPGLSDTQLRKQAAQAIEDALKTNQDYKIVFVATLEAGRVRPDDLVTINTVCDAIQTDFEYGVIFNKVTKRILASLAEEQGMLAACYLPLLHKKPASYLIIGRDEAMEDAPNVYLPAESKSRKDLLSFIAGLKANRIAPSQVGVVNGLNYDERIAKAERDDRELREKEEAERRARNAENSGSCLIQ